MQRAQQTIQVNGMPIHYEVMGEGDPVVFIHGLSESGRVWYRNAPEIARHYRVYLLDLPGFGRMRKQRKHFQLEHMPLWLVGWLRAMGLSKVSLVGHSMGGYVVSMAAAMHPEMVGHLVLVDSIGIPFRTSVLRLVYPALKSIARTTPAFWPCIHYDYTRAGPLMVLKAAHQIVALDELEALSTIQTPTLVVWGEQDDLVPLSSGRQLHERISGSRLLVIPKVNHFSMFSRPQIFNTALLTFLQGAKVGIQGVGASVSARQQR